MVVHDSQAVLWLEFHCLGELLYKLSHDCFSIRHAGVVDKNDSLGALLDWAPAFFIFEVAGDIPQLKIDLPKTCDCRWWVAFKFDDSTPNSRSVVVGQPFGEVAYNICDGRFAAF